MWNPEWYSGRLWTLFKTTASLDLDQEFSFAQQHQVKQMFAVMITSTWALRSPWSFHITAASSLWKTRCEYLFNECHFFPVKNSNPVNCKYTKPLSWRTEDDSVVPYCWDVRLSFCTHSLLNSHLQIKANMGRIFYCEEHRHLFSHWSLFFKNPLKLAALG